MYSASTNTDEYYVGTGFYKFEYDQLNRIKLMDLGVYSDLNTLAPSEYSSSYEFDQNGNLEYLTRSTPAGQIDDFTYVYNNPTTDNRLHQVLDAEGIATVGDLATQGVNNYDYTLIGELKQDIQEDIFSIKWKVTGKVLEITFDDNLNPDKSTSIDKITFTYDAMGNRVMKNVLQLSGAYTKTVYFRDAQGNCMSVYSLEFDAGTSDKDLYLTERSMYGSSRVGTENIGQIIASNVPTNINYDNAQHQTVGDKRFELSNHLGNVLEVVTDRKLPQSQDNVSVEYYTPDVVSQYNYYSFGMLLPNRHGNSSDYRYGFQGYEGDDEVKGEGNSYTTEFRQYDPRVSRWLSTDPMERNLPWQSTYVGFDNNPVLLRDPSGGITETDYYNAETGKLIKHVNDGSDEMVEVDYGQFMGALQLAEQNSLNLDNLDDGRAFSEGYKNSGATQNTINEAPSNNGLVSVGYQAAFSTVFGVAIEVGIAVDLNNGDVTPYVTPNTASGIDISASPVVSYINPTSEQKVIGADLAGSQETIEVSTPVGGIALGENTVNNDTEPTARHSNYDTYQVAIPLYGENVTPGGFTYQSGTTYTGETQGMGEFLLKIILIPVCSFCISLP